MNIIRDPADRPPRKFVEGYMQFCARTDGDFDVFFRRRFDPHRALQPQYRVRIPVPEELYAAAGDVGEIEVAPHPEVG